MGSRRDHDRARPNPVFVAALTAALAPLLVSLVRALLVTGPHYVAYADDAVIELGARAVGSHSVPLGPYSRFGFHQPGPALFYVLALPYRLTGSRSSSVLVGALVVNVAAIVGLGLLARRRGGTLLAVVTLGIALLLMRTLGATTLENPWNPQVTLLPFLTFAFLAWSVALGDAWMLPVALAVASFVVQSHVAFAPVTIGLLALAVVGLLLSWYGPARVLPRARRWPMLAVSAGVVVVMWFAPVVDELSGGGNFANIWRFFTSHRVTLTWLDAVHVVALQWSWRPEWLFGARPPRLTGVPYTSAMDWPVVLLLGAVVVALAWRRRDREVLWLATVVAVGLAAAIVGVHGVVGVVYPYLVQWTWVLGAMLGILIVWGAIRAIPRETVGSAARTTAWCTASVALVALAVAGVVGAVRADVPDASAQSLVRSVRDQVLSQVDLRGRTVQVEGAPSDFNLWSLVLQFERRGAHVRVSPAAAFYVGPWLLRGPAKPDTTLEVGGEPPPPGRVVARYVRPYPARVVRDAARAVAAARRRFGPASKEVRLFERRLRFVTTQPEVAVAVVER